MSCMHGKFAFQVFDNGTLPCNVVLIVVIVPDWVKLVILEELPGAQASTVDHQVNIITYL